MESEPYAGFKAASCVSFTEMQSQNAPQRDKSTMVEFIKLVQMNCLTTLFVFDMYTMLISVLGW